MGRGRREQARGQGKEGHQKDHSGCTLGLTMGGWGVAPGRYAVEHSWINSVGRGGDSCRTWDGHLVCEPLHHRHGLGDPFGERGHLPLQVDQEGVRLPPANDLDGAVGHMRLVKGHGSARPQGVEDDLMRMKAKLFEPNFASRLS